MYIIQSIIKSLYSRFQRGWQICGGYSPINAECRDVDNHTLTFDALSSDLVADILDEPCTTAGILCRDSDQRKPRKCANYAIRFECLCKLNLN